MPLVFLVYALFASVFTVAKEALDHTTPLFLLGSRMLLAGFLMLGYQVLREPKSLSLTPSACLQACLLGFFNIYITNALELWGLQFLTSFKTCFLYSLSPFLSALFSYFFIKERLSIRKWIGLVVGFAGFIPILTSQEGAQEALSRHFWLFSWPEIAVVGAVISSVLGWIILKQLVHKEGCPPLVANGYSMAIGGFLATCHSLLVDSWDPFPVTNWPIFIQCALFLMFVSNILCYNLYGVLLKRFSTTFMSFAGLSTPLFTALFGWFFRGEVVTYDFFISLSVVCIGLFVFYSEELKEEQHRKDPPHSSKEEEIVPYIEEIVDTSH